MFKGESEDRIKRLSDIARRKLNSYTQSPISWEQIEAEVERAIKWGEFIKARAKILERRERIASQAKNN